MLFISLSALDRSLLGSSFRSLVKIYSCSYECSSRIPRIDSTNCGPFDPDEKFFVHLGKENIERPTARGGSC